MPSSAIVALPVQARRPPTSHTKRAAPGEGTLVSIAAGEAKMPEPVGFVSFLYSFEMIIRILTYNDTYEKCESIECVELTRKCWRSGFRIAFFCGSLWAIISRQQRPLFVIICGSHGA